MKSFRLASIWMECKGVIAVNNKLPISIPEDMELFNEVTKRSVCIMGFNTFNAMKNVLRDRVAVVLSSKKGEGDNYFFVNSIQGALKLSGDLIQERSLSSRVNVVGGLEVYEDFMPLVDIIFRSEVRTHALIAKPGDEVVVAPRISDDDFSLLYSSAVRTSNDLVEGGAFVVNVFRSRRSR